MGKLDPLRPPLSHGRVSAVVRREVISLPAPLIEPQKSPESLQVEGCRISSRRSCELVFPKCLRLTDQKQH